MAGIRPDSLEAVPFVVVSAWLSWVRWDRPVWGIRTRVGIQPELSLWVNGCDRVVSPMKGSADGEADSRGEHATCCTVTCGGVLIYR